MPLVDVLADYRKMIYSRPVDMPGEYRRMQTLKLFVQRKEGIKPQRSNLHHRYSCSLSRAGNCNPCIDLAVPSYKTSIFGGFSFNQLFLNHPVMTSTSWLKTKSCLWLLIQQEKDFRIISI